MNKLTLILVCFVISLIGVERYSGYTTQRELDRLTLQVKRAAPIGTHRNNVELALTDIGLEHVYGKSDNAIYGGKHAGHFRLVYTTIFIYKVQLDERGNVIRVETTFVNDGL
jgi:hypothetical protein